MYQPYNPLWILIPFAVFMVALAVVTYWSRKAPLAVPKGVQLALAALAASQLLLALGIINHNNRRMRQELVSIQPGEVTKLTLSRGDVRSELKNKTQIAELFAVIQSVRTIAAHHSSPEDKVDFCFDYRGQRYCYQLGRDSDRPDEYWVIPVGRSTPGREGMEIGRVQSKQLGPMLRRMLGDKP